MFLPQLSLCAEEARSTFGAFAGGGLSAGQLSLLPANSSINSKFQEHGYFAEAGLDIPMGPNFGFRLSAEYGQSSSLNSSTSQTYLESGTINYYCGKLGLVLRLLELGGGYRFNDITIRSLSTPTPGYLESNYSGWLPLGYIRIAFDINNQFRFALESQYVGGTVNSVSLPTSNANFSEISVGLRAFLLFK
jgi:hypothetical protein